MNRAMIQQHLALAERYVAEGEFHLARQRELIMELERDGHEGASDDARGLLKLFEETQAMHIADRDRLRAELANYEARPES